MSFRILFNPAISCCFSGGGGGVYIAITLSICLSLHTCKHRKEGGPGLEEHQGRLLKGDYSREIIQGRLSFAQYWLYPLWFDSQF